MKLKYKYTESQCCDCNSWFIGEDSIKFCMHPKGFKIFINPNSLLNNDEYSNGDPYLVKMNCNSEFHKNRVKCTLELLSKIIKTDQIYRILDAGCGEGHITNIIKETYQNAELSAFDYSISAIEHAVDHFPCIDFVVANVDAVPYVEEYFDVVVLNNIFEHVLNPVNLIINLKRIIRKNGYIIISTPSRYNSSNLFRVLTGNNIRFMSDKHITEYSVGQMLEMLKFAGYNIEIILGGYENSKSNLSIRGFLWYKLFIPFAKTIFSFLGSHHIFANTMFILAKVN